MTGLGYDLVEIERSAGGLLRVTIDLPWQPPVEGEPVVPEQFVTVEDCEKITRQLQFALEVDGVDYARGGAVELWRSPQGWRAVWTADVRGDRPWSRVGDPEISDSAG